MCAKSKSTPARVSSSVGPIKQLVLHDVTNSVPSTKAMLRRRSVAVQPAAGTALHSRHHVSPKSQG
jgi:hypothetical protein